MTARIRPPARSAVLLRAGQYTLLFAGLALLGYCGWAFFEMHAYQWREERAFDQIRRARSSHLPPPETPAVRHAVLGKIDIPQVGISAIVAEGDDPPTLKRAVGHVPGTAMPGEPGNVVLAAHRDTFFRPLRQVHKGDTIELITWNGAYHYRVESIRVVGPNDVSVLEPANKSELTLVTCYPFYFVGPAPKRFIVRAGLASG